MRHVPKLDVYQSLTVLVPGQRVNILRDGDIVGTVPDVGDVMRWFHQNTLHSAAYALLHEGYKVEAAS